MKKMNLVLGIHCHQPVGNFDSVFEKNYIQAYQPFLNMLLKYPEIKFSLHYSGVLLEWFEKNHPEYFDIIRTLVNRNQVELIGGAFYEPILPVIPDYDKIGQIKLLSDYIEKTFSYKVKGMWLAERVWESHLPKALNEAGIEYTILDDAHFKFVGLKTEEILGYFKTEEQGKYIKIFPISEKLRYTIPFRMHEETINYLRNLSSTSGNNLVVMIDDGEKFGSWPETFHWVYEEHWLENFFKSLIENKEWLQLLTFSEYLEKASPLGIIYISDGSYTEMSEWTLVGDEQAKLEKLKSELKDRNQLEDYRALLRGGFWRNYFFKYQESNIMHKKMLLVGQKISASCVPMDIKQKAQKELWKAQCNCAYWHGVFGGLYLPHLRSAVFNHLIKAEQIIDETTYDDDKWIEIKKEDFNCDGHPEIIVNSAYANYYFDPHNGGVLFEMDYKPCSFNIIDTFSRRKEFYHSKIINKAAEISHDTKGTKSIHDILNSKESGLEKYINYDRYQHRYLVDHFLEENTTLENFERNIFTEQGNFVNQPYTYKIEDKEQYIEILFQRNGEILHNKKQIPVSIIKSILISKTNVHLDINYTIKNLGDVELLLWFGAEFAFTFLAGKAYDRFYKIADKELDNKTLDSVGEEKNISSLQVFDEWQKIKMSFNFNIPCLLWRFPIETISQSESGLEKVYQNSVILPNWRFSLSPDNEWKVNIKNLIQGI